MTPKEIISKATYVGKGVTLSADSNDKKLYSNFLSFDNTYMIKSQETGIGKKSRKTRKSGIRSAEEQTIIIKNTHIQLREKLELFYWEAAVNVSMETVSFETKHFVS